MNEPFTFAAKLSRTAEPGDPKHDLEGDGAQVHECADGSLLITFSDEFLTKIDWREGDELQWIIQDVAPFVQVRNLRIEP